MILLPRLKKSPASGYHPTMSVKSRHRVLLKKIRTLKETPLSVARHFLLLSTLTKRTLPKASKVYKANSKWLFALKKKKT
jgi:hypothetical protein